MLKLTSGPKLFRSKMPAVSSSSKWKVSIVDGPTLAQTEGRPFIYGIRANPPADAGNSSITINWVVDGRSGDFAYTSGSLTFGPGILQRELAIQSLNNNVDDGLGPERPFTVRITAADPSKVDILDGGTFNSDIIDDEY